LNFLPNNHNHRISLRSYLYDILHKKYNFLMEVAKDANDEIQDDVMSLEMIQKKKSKKTNYKKINNQTRQKLIEMVNYIFNFYPYRFI
jgi:hypothetical protein